MAVAMKNNDKSSMLNISAKDFWFTKLRPQFGEVCATCRTDPEIERSLTKLTNSFDTKITYEQYSEAKEDLDVILKVLMDKSYWTNSAIKRADQEEVTKIKDLVNKMNDFRLILTVDNENKTDKEEPKTRDRLDYKPSNDGSMGTNLDYEHNIKELSKPIEQKRIPNTETPF